MKWKTVKHRELSKEEAMAIARLKNQHWPYGIQSQLNWMKTNIANDDVHLIGKKDSSIDTGIQAYLTLSVVQAVIDDADQGFIGIGGVCVDQALRHTGIGRELMIESKRYILARRQPGILLCKDELVGFYEKCGWHLLRYETAIVSGELYRHNIMTLEQMPFCGKIDLDRNF